MINTTLLLLSLIASAYSEIDYKRPTVLPLQVQVDTVQFDQGSTLAVLIGIVKPDRMQARNQYFQSVFPIASKYQYNLGVAFNVRTPTRGNYHPGFVAIASWPSAEHRYRFLQDPAVPSDLSAQRREIWARFDQMFYENIDEAVTFEVRSDKIYVFSNFWVEDQQLFKSYLQSFTAGMAAAGGEFLTLLEEGQSPKDHMYEPNAMVISQWDNEEAFKRYLNKLGSRIPNDGLKNTNEFATSYVFGFGS